VTSGQKLRTGLASKDPIAFARQTRISLALPAATH